MTVKRSFWGVFLFYNPYKHYENENKCKIILYINLFVVDLLYQITIKTQKNVKQLLHKRRKKRSKIKLQTFFKKKQKPSRRKKTTCRAFSSTTFS